MLSFHKNNFIRVTILTLLLSPTWLKAEGVEEISDSNLYYWENFSTIDDVLEAGKEFAKVTETYGPLVVQEGKFKVETSPIPWSSWWYPVWKDELFANAADGTRSTLRRYDRLVEKITGKDPKSADYERQNIFDPTANRWSGRCDAWALASLMFPAPKEDIVLQGVRFRIRDQQALLIKAVENVEGTTYFGQRFNGQWDGVYGDLFPDQFHRFMQAELFTKKRPFIMDHDAGAEVWNTPVFRAQTEISKDATNPNVMHVKSWVFTASPHVEDLDFLGTIEVIRIYTYDLYGKMQGNGNFHVTHGVWTEDSRWDHPDFVMQKPDSLQSIKFKSFNPKLEFQYIKQLTKLSESR